MKKSPLKYMKIILRSPYMVVENEKRKKTRSARDGVCKKGYSKWNNFLRRTTSQRKFSESL